MKKMFVGFSIFIAAIFYVFLAKAAIAADDENCLMCHKYIKMGRITEEGERKYYYVDEEIFSKTVHNRVKCRDCHSYIEKLPHDPVKEGVQCNSKCHSIQNPATRKDFDHNNIYDVYMKSVHGREKVAAKEVDKDKPYCIFCHTNPLYIPHEIPNADGTVRSAEVPAAIADRCDVCHQKREFVEHRYLHTARRILSVKRSPQEVVELCLTCHGNEEFLERHEKLHEGEGKHLGKKFTFAGEAYQESFHGKVTKYGFKEAANCLSCHAKSENYYLAVHDIRSSKDPESTTHKNNRVNTCGKCHTDANKNFARIDPHPTERKDDNPFIYYIANVYGPFGDMVTYALLGLTILETIGRKRDGIAWVLRRGSTWRKKSKRGRDRR
ncbi:MAG: hypothetical protein HZB79_08815 [Deltaproteobacteria bacterium]|nr:hypothetical protein [Deltaproteobacteria bacterium]